MDFFWGQNSIFEPVFTFFQKNRVVSWKDSSNKIISGRNKKFGKNWPKIKGQSHFAQKRVLFLGKTPFLSPFLHFFKKVELFRGKTVRINIFPGGIKKSVNIGKKNKGFWRGEGPFPPRFFD